MPTPISIGWAEADITPEQPVYISGQFPARLSEEILDPLSAVVLILQSDAEHVIQICCDLVSISDELYGEVRQKVAEALPEVDRNKILINATHTHTGPEVRPPNPIGGHTSAAGSGVELDAMPIGEYVDFASTRIAEAVQNAWNSKAPGGIAYGSGFAVLGRNRRWVDRDGGASMYGLNEATADRFDHIEGFEDHSVNLLATYDAGNNLTGIIFNAPMTAQETEHLFSVSADVWCEARIELRKRFGKNLYILTQVSAAGDLSPHVIYDRPTQDRMLELKGRSSREELAQRIANAAGDILPYLPPTIETMPILKHLVETVELPLNPLTEVDVAGALQEADKLKTVYEEELQKLQDHPELRNEKRWYVPVTAAFRRMSWFQSVAARFEHQKTHSTLPTELHIIRIGDVVMATNPFEYYLDFGVQIKVRSPALQTFLVQLTGLGTYVPSLRSSQGGGYGSVPASCRLGPEGGQVLADKTVELIRSLWDD